MAVARTTKNEELRTKNSRAAAPNFNCRFAALLHQKSFIPHQPARATVDEICKLATLARKLLDP